MEWLKHDRLQLACRRLSQLVQCGMHRLRSAGQSDDLNRRIVYVRHGGCLGRVCAVDWEPAQAEPSCGLFFEGWRWHWRGVWEQFCDWQTPRDPAAVTIGEWLWLRARGATHAQLKLILRVVRRGQVITPQEYACATLLGS